jgi:hypothetical protein
MLPSMRVTYGGGTAGLSLTPYAIEVSVERSVAAVPEPSTWAMLLFGFAGIGCVSYRRLKDCRTPWIENWGIRVARFPGEQCGHDGSGKNRRNAPADAEKCGELGGVIRHAPRRRRALLPNPDELRQQIVVDAVLTLLRDVWIICNSSFGETVRIWTV